MASTTKTRQPRDTTPRDERPISERQESYIGRLADERDLTGAPASATEALTRVPDLSNQAAGDLIDILNALPIKPGMEPSAPGWYVKDGVMFLVVENGKKTSTYAKRLSVRGGKARLDYDREAGRAFGDKPLTVAKARAAAVKAGLAKTEAERVIV